MNAEIAMAGNLSATLFRPVQKAPLAWRLRNQLNWLYISSWLAVVFAKAFSRLTGIPTLTSELRATQMVNGRVIDYGVLSRRVITTAGCEYIVDAWNNSTTAPLDVMKYQGCGVGTGAEAIGDTALGTECSAAGVIDATLCTGGAYRPASTMSQPSSRVIQLAASIGFDGPATPGATGYITEHGIFSAASSGTLMDRSSWTAPISVVDDSVISFVYTCTFTPGG